MKDTQSGGFFYILVREEIVQIGFKKVRGDTAAFINYQDKDTLIGLIEDQFLLVPFSFKVNLAYIGK